MQIRQPSIEHQIIQHVELNLLFIFRIVEYDNPQCSHEQTTAGRTKLSLENSCIKAIIK